MNCDQVQARLSEYLEKSLDREIHEAVESHLSSCPRCQAEAEILAESVRSVAGLPSVEPPLGFSQKVMAHIRAEGAKPYLWHRLFFPIRVKIPIHATALLLVGGFAVYLYQANQPHEAQLTKALRPKSEPTLRQDLTREQKKKGVKSPTSAASPLVLSEQEAKLAPEVVGAVKKPEGPGGEEGRSVGARRRQAEYAKKSTVTSARPSRALSTEAADYEFVLGPGEALEGVKVLREKLDALVNRVQGAYVQAEEEMKMQKRDLLHEPQIIWLDLSEDKYEQFKAELGSLGKVELTSRVTSLEDRPAGKGRTQLRIKITILPPKG